MPPEFNRDVHVGVSADSQMARVKLPEGALLMPKPVDFEKCPPSSKAW